MIPQPENVQLQICGVASIAGDVIKVSLAYEMSSTCDRACGAQPVRARLVAGAGSTCGQRGTDKIKAVASNTRQQGGSEVPTIRLLRTSAGALDCLERKSFTTAIISTLRGDGRVPSMRSRVT
ncbi:unnamed protein product [Chrysodeixis includens]|uniref:Uncharacterized protein n=1 Tax=Chrysodeixis includens TaxID=689277 RepID=A0A9N8KW59_CHRIL|nr:unnamed protein product [Chrysodeixis includens]